MTGKRKCSLLKSIRCQIAEKNGIEFSTPECTFQGECRGTCPKCEAELRYLTEELEKIKKSGRRVAVAGIAAAMITTSASGCARQPQDDFNYILPGVKAEVSQGLTGIVAVPSTETETTGEELTELDGDVAYPVEPEELIGEVYEPVQEPDEEVFVTTGIIAAPAVPEISAIAEMSEEDALAALESVAFDSLREEWASYLVFGEENERYGVFSIGHVTIQVYYDEAGGIVNVTVADEPGENADGAE